MTSPTQVSNPLKRLLRHCALFMLLVAMTDAHSATAPAALDITLRAVLNAQPSEQRGTQIYKQRCAQCHQSAAQGWPEQQIPALAGQQYEYLAKQLLDFMDMERNAEVMHRVVNQRGLRDVQSIADVIGYVANLPITNTPERGSGKDITLGKQIFDKDCTSCHSKTGEGNPDLWVPNLRGQHYGYLLVQMRRMADTQRANISPDLHRMFATYAPQELEAVASYLSNGIAE